MSTLLLIRHGQATYFGEEADQLTKLGREQSRLLGEHWARRGLRLDRVLVGPCVLHRQTLEEVAAGLALPEPELVDALDEYPALEIFKRAMGEGTVAGPKSGSEGSFDFEQTFVGLMRRYAAGEIAYEDVESFSRFRERVARLLEQVTVQADRGHTIAAFTSGGPVAAALGHVLDLTDERVLELSWTPRNTSITELVFRPGRLSLSAFNRHPHLDEQRLVTVR
jgi:broad specificity phosphatase PhoE